MMKHSRFLTGAVVLLFTIACVSFGGVSQKDKDQGLQKTATNDLYRPFLINKIFNYYGNNGDGSYNKFSGDNEGFEFTKGEGKAVIFEDGVVWGGFHKGRATPKVGGSVYRHGLQAGRILTNGTLTTDPVADDASLAKYRVYRVRPDIGPSTHADASHKTTFDADMKKKMAEEEVVYISRFESYTEQQIYDQYILDWNQWPASEGAPFQDVNSNGVYDPNVDVPGVPGSDQTLWYVANDMSASRATNLAGSPPIGIEMQRTIWGYKREGALGFTIFASSLLINKSGAPIDSMFLVQWSDPDLGDASDDYAGCDVPRSLGIIYNGKPVDATFGTKVPAGGFVFFQGPRVPAVGDSAIFRLKRIYGYKNLKMSAFTFFINGSATYGDPAQGSGGDIQWYRLMNGRIGSSGQPFIDPKTGLATKFTLSGDPVSGTGWIDGPPISPPQDRRICLVTGPFTMAAGDTQELVVANLAGLGADRISSIAVLRWYTDLAQSAYNGLFNIPSPPPGPKINATALDGEVVLEWGDPVQTAITENFASVGYRFEGYNVYQLPVPSFTPDAKRLATYDVVNTITTVFDDQYDEATGAVLKKPVQFGSDGGLNRFFRTKQDVVNNRNLVNGTRYYFAVTAYSVNTAAKPAQLESSPVVLILTPQSPNPGNRFGASGDTLKTVQTTTGSLSEGQVIPLVIDPTRLTGHQYKVTFKTDAGGNTTWDLTDVTRGVVVLANQTNQSGDDDYKIVDGLMVKVTGPPNPGMKDWHVGADGVRHWTFADATGFGLEGFELTIGNAYDHWFTGGVGYDRHKNVQIRYATANGTWDPRADQSANANFSKAYRYLRGATSAPAVPSFAPWIVNATAGYAFQEFNWSVPWAAYDVEATPPRRLAVGHLENNQPLGLVDGRHWPQVNGTFAAGVTNVTGNGPREWFFIYDVNYSTTQDATLAIDILNNEVPMMWMGTVNRRSSAPNYASTSTFDIIAAHINTANNTFTWTAPTPTLGDPALAKADVAKVNVFPNPYIGFNTQETTRYARFVTFTHLPKKATIRIFNLAGILLRTIQKDDPTQFAQWDLTNDSGFPAAAGMYIIYVDMPEVGATKTLKLGVIPETQYLDRW